MYLLFSLAVAQIAPFKRGFCSLLAALLLVFFHIAWRISFGIVFVLLLSLIYPKCLSLDNNFIVCPNFSHW